MSEKRTEYGWYNRSEEKIDGKRKANRRKKKILKTIHMRDKGEPETVLASIDVLLGIQEKKKYISR